MRNFGISRRPASGDSLTGDSSSVGEPLDIEIPSPALREFAALIFVAVFCAAVLILFLLLRFIPFGEVFSVR